jgi:hypothetical protein
VAHNWTILLHHYVSMPDLVSRPASLINILRFSLKENRMRGRRWHSDVRYPGQPVKVTGSL